MKMKNDICRTTRSVAFWDGYAPWYKLWVDHNHYHDKIIDVLTTMVEPDWKVLDIGAGNGILSLPLCTVGCSVTALEPSVGMRALLSEEASDRSVDRISIDEHRWEDVHEKDMCTYDLIMACNSLHVTEAGFSQALERVFKARPKNVFVATELHPEVELRWPHERYALRFAAMYETESSFAYHSFGEAIEHHAYRKGRPLCLHEKNSLRAQLTYRNEHLWMTDKAVVGMYWWRSAQDTGAC